MNRKKLTVLIVTLLIFLTLVVYSTYAFFAMGSFNITNAVNVNILTDENNMVFDVLGGQMSLTAAGSQLKSSTAGNVVAQNTSTITVNFQPNTPHNMVCNYDIVYEWTSNDKYQSHLASNNDKEITAQATLSYNSAVSQGLNYIQGENDLANLSWNNSSATVVKNAQISGTGSTISTATWTLATKFYNANGDQSTLVGKSLSGKFKVANVKCKGGSKTSTLAEYITYDASRSGTDAVSNSPWILTSDHTNEWRYAGKNPDNYIQFNGELWRIIGVMPDMTYCTGTYGNANECNTTATGSLVKIIRNDSLGDFIWDKKQTGVGSSTIMYGSNDWSDSQLMLMLNGTNYLNTGYDVNGNKLHQSYTITSNVVAGNGYNYYNASYSYLDGNGTTVYVPSQATKSTYTATSGTVPKKITSSALSQIATVKWDLYGTNSYNDSSIPSLGSPIDFYNKERNINGIGAVYTGTTPENRPVYWYGKIGLMYPSDYGYATNGGSTYNRSTCLGYQIYGWNNGSYQSDCAGGSFLWYNNITSTAPGTSGTTQWTITPFSHRTDDVFAVTEPGYVAVGASITHEVRPVLYLKADTLINGGTGTWNDPYTISTEDYNIAIAPKEYWYPTTLSTWNNNTNQYEPNYTFPATGGTVQTSGQATGHNVYIGQDNSKYYACATIQGHEICLSQPYTQYGLSGHTINTTVTSTEQTNAKGAIHQIFIDAEISIDINDNCDADDYDAGCLVGGFYCGVFSDGHVHCDDDSESVYCGVDSAGHANCGDLGSLW